MKMLLLFNNKNLKARKWKLFLALIFISFYITSFINVKKYSGIFTDKTGILFLLLFLGIGYIASKILENIVDEKKIKNTSLLIFTLLLIYENALLFPKDNLYNFDSGYLYITALLFGFIIRCIYIDVSKKQKVEVRGKKESIILTTFACAVLIIMSLLLRLYKISEVPFRNDERFQLEAAQGYRNTGIFQRWDFQINKPMERLDDLLPMYERAKPYTWQIAQVFKLLPINEANSRIVSIIWGTLFLLEIMYIAFFFTKKVAIPIGIGMITVFNPLLVWSSVVVREYSFFASLSLLFIFSCHLWLKILHKILEKRHKKKDIVYFLGISTLLLTLMVFHRDIHPILIILILIFFCYTALILLNYIKHKYRLTRLKKNILITIGCIAVILIAFLLKGEKFPITVNIKNPMLSYIWYIFQDFRLPIFALGLTIIGFIKTWRHSKWLVLLSIGSVIIMIFFADRYPSQKYAIFILPTIWLITVMGLYETVNFFLKAAKPWQRNIAFALSLFFILPWISFPNVKKIQGITQMSYVDSAMLNRSDVRAAYDYIAKTKRSDEKVFIRSKNSYYLQGIVMPNEEFPDMYERYITAVMKTKNTWFIYPNDNTSLISKKTIGYLEKNCEKKEPISDDTNTAIYYCSQK